MFSHAVSRYQYFRFTIIKVEMSKLKRKELEDQVIIVTGACDPVGKATVQMATSSGARVVMVGDDESALQKLADAVSRSGGNAMSVVADVTREADVARTLRAAVRTYGTFDTWINTATITLSGNCLDTSVDVMRRFLDTNFWSVVNCSRAAVQHIKQSGDPGVMINLNPVSSDPTTIQPFLTILNDAVHAWFDALRLEAEQQEVRMAFTLVYPGPESAFRERRRGLLRHVKEASLPTPEEVAAMMLSCATSPKEEVFVPAGTRIPSSLVTRTAKRPGLDGLSRAVAPGLNRNSLSPEATKRLPDPQLTEDSATRARSRPGSPRTLFSSIVLASLGAGMWFLSKSRPRPRNEKKQQPESMKNE